MSIKYQSSKKIEKDIIDSLDYEKQQIIEKEKFEDVKNSLGSTVSKVCEWNGVDILDVLQIALEDSNFHTLNKEITKIREEENLKTNWSYCENI